MLTEKAKEILKSIPRVPEFVFTIDGKRVTYDMYDDNLEKACMRANIPFKPSHSIRRTFASRCAEGGLPIEKLRAHLGHTDISTTKGYIYDVTPEKEALDTMNRVL